MTEIKKPEYLQFQNDESVSDLFKIPQTYTDIGAAPGGFGLGQETPVITNADTAIYPGFYSLNGDNMDKTSASTPPGNLRFGSLVVTRRYRYIYQYACYANEAATRYSIDYGDSWSAWEWINPPKGEDIEYRTTERFLGQPVYVQTIHIDNLGPANQMQTKPITINNKGYTIRYEFTTLATNVVITPYITNLEIYNNQIKYAHNSEYLGGKTIDTYVTIYYTKQS